MQGLATGKLSKHLPGPCEEQPLQASQKWAVFKHIQALHGTSARARVAACEAGHADVCTEPKQLHGLLRMDPLCLASWRAEPGRSERHGAKVMRAKKRSQMSVLQRPQAGLRGGRAHTPRCYHLTLGRGTIRHCGRQDLKAFWPARCRTMPGGVRPLATTTGRVATWR